MKSLAAIAALLWFVTASHAQQPQSYTFVLTPDEANTTLNQLGEMKWKDVNPLLQKLIGQLKAQNQPSPAGPPKSDHPSE